MLESAEELTRVCEVNEDRIHKAFHAALDADESDNDEALDTDWVPSDCESMKTRKSRPKAKLEAMT